MENDTSDEQASEASMREEKVGFQQVVAVASEWMSDFMFLKLCRSFRDGNLEEFNEALPVFEGKFNLKEDQPAVFASNFFYVWGT